MMQFMPTEYGTVPVMMVGMDGTPMGMTHMPMGGMMGGMAMGGGRRPRGRKSQGGGGENYNYDAEVETGEAIKVSAKSEAKGVAGRIHAAAQEGIIPAILATGVGSINTAVKAVAIARTHLNEEGRDMFAHPELREEGKSSLTITFRQAKPSNRAPKGRPMKVARNSNVGAVAGAIAARVRNDEDVSLVSIGPHSVTQAVKAICFARQYLEEDGKSVSFRPNFQDVFVNDEKSTAICFHIFPMNL